MKNFLSLLIIFLPIVAFTQQKLPKDKQDIDNSIEAHKKDLIAISDEIWAKAETAFEEYDSSKILSDYAENNGFAVEKGVAGMPTAFIVEFGSGSPVIAILGEYDALPGLSQQAIPEKKSAGNKAGHACGHHLFGTASAAAAISVKQWMQENNIKGTIRFYGCPAEEGGSGKVYMTRAGLFDDADVALHWHPNNKNSYRQIQHRFCYFL